MMRLVTRAMKSKKIIYTNNNHYSPIAIVLTGPVKLQSLKEN